MATRARGGDAGSAQAGEVAQVIGAVRDPMAQVSRQQTSLYLFIEQLGNRVDLLRDSTERRFESVRADLGNLLAERPAATAEPAPGRLPPAVGRLFASALDALGGLRQIDLALRQLFTASGSADNAVWYQRALTQVRAALRQDRATPAAGVLLLLQRLVVTFQDSVTEWYRSLGGDVLGRVLPADQDALGALCLAYDAVYEFLPTFRLKGLADFAAAYAAGPEIERGIDPELLELLNSLGARVQSAMLEAIGTA
jgi:hypothetical protein